MFDVRRQRGEGRLGFIITLALFAAAVFAAIQFVPVKIAAYQFEDFIEQECRMAAVRQGNSHVAQRILDKAEELEIPLDKNNLSVKRTRAEMIIEVRYVQPVDFKVATYDFRFDHKERAPLF